MRREPPRSTSPDQQYDDDLTLWCRRGIHLLPARAVSDAPRRDYGTPATFETAGFELYI